MLGPTNVQTPVADILSARYYELEVPGVTLISNPAGSPYLVASSAGKLSQIVLDHKNNDNGICKKNTGFPSRCFWHACAGPRGAS
jgi:hypothetical protein